MVCFLVCFFQSEGEFQFGNYRKEADELHSVVSYLSQEKYDVTTIVGHSKGLFPYLCCLIDTIM
jgi:hypothetical protein